jgi:hypothetical protein
VFDEWAILTTPTRAGGVLYYEGPRPERFRLELPDDAEPLRASTKGKTFTEGDIEFVTDATTTKYDAFVKVGASSYLVLNNTKRSLADLRADGKWLNVQTLLFELSEKFRADPLVAE